GDTPLRRWKRETYPGGAGVPLLVHWPRGFTSRGEVRSQYAHLVDIAPTVLRLLHPEPPARIPRVTHPPLHGASGAHTPGDPPDTGPAPVLRVVRSSGHRPRRMAGGVPVARPVLHRSGQTVRHADHR